MGICERIAAYDGHLTSHSNALHRRRESRASANREGAINASLSLSLSLRRSNATDESYDLTVSKRRGITESGKEKNDGISIIEQMKSRRAIQEERCDDEWIFLENSYLMHS